MAEDWIDRLVAEKRERSEETRMDKELKLREARLFDSLVGEFWSGLVRHLNQCIDRFNKQVPDKDRILMFQPENGERIQLQVRDHRKRLVELDRRVRKLTAARAGTFDLCVSEDGIAIKEGERIVDQDELAKSILSELMY